MEKTLEFIRRCHERNIPIHGFMAVKDGKVVAEEYFKPYTADSLHRMFSVAKSFTALATGCLAADGKIGLDDCICDYFPEYVDDNTHPWIKEMTVRQMLMMATCHSKTTYRRFEEDDWCESFFKTKPDHRPGTIFAYDTSAAHVLAALVEKKTGMMLLDYMREKFLDKIGFSKEAYFMTDPKGTSQGGTGLMCTLQDVVKVGLLVMNGGKYGDEQLISETFMHEAVIKQIDTGTFEGIDKNRGYGYYFWRTRHGGCAMYGMGGQIVFIFPELKFVFAVMADAQGVSGGEQMLFDIFYDTFYAWVRPKNWTPFALGRDDKIEDECFGLPYGKDDSLMAQKLQGKTAVFEDNEAGLKKLSFDFEGKKLGFVFTDKEFTIEYDIDAWKEITFPGSSEKCISAGIWRSENRFLLKVQVVDEDLSPVTVEVGFRTDDAVSVQMKNTSEPAILRSFSGFAGGQIEA